MIIRSRTRRVGPADASRANGHGSTSNPVTRSSHGPKRTIRGGQPSGSSPSLSQPSRQSVIPGQPAAPAAPVDDVEPVEPVELVELAGPVEPAEPAAAPPAAGAPEPGEGVTGPTANGLLSA